jgi:hypothetical protein
MKLRRTGGARPETSRIERGASLICPAGILLRLGGNLPSLCPMRRANARPAGRDAKSQATLVVRSSAFRRYCGGGKGTLSAGDGPTGYPQDFRATHLGEMRSASAFAHQRHTSRALCAHFPYAWMRFCVPFDVRGSRHCATAARATPGDMLATWPPYFFSALSPWKAS